MPLTIDYNSAQFAAALNMMLGGTGAQAKLSTQVYGGKVRPFYGYFKNTTGSTIATAKNIALAQIPAGILLPFSKIYYKGFTTSCTLDIGWQDYTKNNAAQTVVSASANGIRDDLAVATDGSYEIGSNNQAGLVFDGQVLLVAQTGGAAMPNNAEIFAWFLVAVD